ncbi:MAG: PilZ domain-containing protein [Bacteriovoracaceae bacterium]|jgi:hypothetical protein|nr:PilZ domain-containing protein [Bacteriovoracaceae bacterium]
MKEHKGYQRRYLRAPYKQEVLYTNGDLVFKGRAKNISEGGILFEQIGQFFEKENLDFMIKLPEYPLFKNYDLEKLQKFNVENFSVRIIRFQARIVRTIEVDAEQFKSLKTKIALEIMRINPFYQAKIAHYVDVFSSNLIYLQVLIDTLENDKFNLDKIRLISQALGYSPSEKISMLRQYVEHDYKSLQWL